MIFATERTESWQPVSWTGNRNGKTYFGKKKKISKNDHLKSKSFCIGTISILPIQSSLRLYLCTVDIRVWKDLRD